MRLLLTGDAHRAVGDGLEIAASPDSVRPEPWKWSLTMLEPSQCAGVNGASDVDVVQLALAPYPLGQGGGRCLQLRHSRKDITAGVDTVDITAPVRLERPAREIWILVGLAGTASEGRRRITPADALVLEGDDPTHVEMTAHGCEHASLARFRLSNRTIDADLRWVP